LLRCSACEEHTIRTYASKSSFKEITKTLDRHMQQMKKKNDHSMQYIKKLVLEKKKSPARLQLPIGSGHKKEKLILFA
jgi:hypothetical protein